MVLIVLSFWFSSFKGANEENFYFIENKDLLSKEGHVQLFLKFLLLTYVINFKNALGLFRHFC